MTLLHRWKLCSSAMHSCPARRTGQADARNVSPSTTARGQPCLNSLASSPRRFCDNLDIFWLKDDALEESANLPAPEIIAQEITDDLEAALEQFATIAEDLKK
jgi:hypothetical protein